MMPPRHTEQQMQWHSTVNGTRIVSISVFELLFVLFSVSWIKKLSWTGFKIDIDIIISLRCLFPLLFIKAVWKIWYCFWGWDNFQVNLIDFLFQNSCPLTKIIFGWLVTSHILRRSHWFENNIHISLKYSAQMSIRCCQFSEHWNNRIDWYFCMTECVSWWTPQNQNNWRLIRLFWVHLQSPSIVWSNHRSM